MSSEIDLQRVLPAWLELSSKTDVSLGLDPAEAFERAEGLLNDLRFGQASTEGWAPEADQVEVLHALVALVCRPEPENPNGALRDVELVFNYVSALRRPSEAFGGCAELASTCALQGWRLARLFATWPQVENWASRIRSTSDASALAEQAMRVPIADRQALVSPLHLSEIAVLHCVCETLRSRVEMSPAAVLDEARFFCQLVEDPLQPIGLRDEREYFVGELAIVAGAASRLLFRIEEAKGWLQTAETRLSLVGNARPLEARVAYQRLSLALEERRIDEVLEMAPRLSNTFRRLVMADDALKCLFLEGIAYWERGDVHRAIEIHVVICAEAEALGNARLVGNAANNLTRYFAAVGDIDRALDFARMALPLLQQLSRVHLVKLQWSVGDLLKEQGNRAAALDAYRQALVDAGELGMRGDVATIHLIIADSLLEAGKDAQAEQEIRAALPIIEKAKMVPEGIAALSLLRESLRRQQIDQGALRDLHRHLEDRTR